MDDLLQNKLKNQTQTPGGPVGVNGKANAKRRCGVEITLDVIGGKWKTVILYQLRSKSVLRFGELKKLMPRITTKMLTQQLRELEVDKLVQRQVYPVVPPKVEYRLTPMGESIYPVLKSMHDWGEFWGRELSDPKA